MMDKQQEQTKQNPNQEVEYISAFLDEDEEVNESEFDESTGEQEKEGNVAEDQQNKPEEEEKLKKPKRPRKTIEQEIAELDAKREKLVEKKRKQDTHKKIVLGVAINAAIKTMCNSGKSELVIKIIDELKKQAINFKENDKICLTNIIKELELFIR